MGFKSPSLARFIKDMTMMQVTLPEVMKLKQIAQAGDIAKAARSRGAGLGSVHAKAAPGIKAVNQAPIVRMDGAAHPYIYGAEFGGGGKPTTKQFPPHRGGGERAGYMLFPTIREKTSGFMEQYADLVQRQAGWGIL